jgi:cysteinyl-tRNA synthetase
MSFVYLVRVLLTLGSVLGLFQATPQPAEMAPGARERIEKLIAEREEARRRRDWNRSDALRTELQALGVTVEDTSAGTRWTWSGR